MAWVGSGISPTTDVFTGSYVPIDAHSNVRINAIVDELLTPRMLAFRQIVIYDEQGVLMPDGSTWRFTYGNWNTTYTLTVRKNGAKIASTAFTADATFGTITLTAAVVAGDNVTATYCFDYFPVGVLAGYIYQALDTINASAYGPPTSYTLADAPTYWDAVIADIAFAIAMERLILDYDLWVGRVIFAIPSVEDGGDIMSALETLKTNAEERAARALDNEKFKVGNYQSPPTSNYYAAIRGIGRSGVHSGSSSYGRTRGWRRNKYS